MKSKKIMILTLVFMLVISFNTQSFALEEGAYLIGRTTSYANPLTGKTEDGGTNISLGDSMVKSIVEKQFLVEKVGDEYYVTIGIGLVSNIENVRILLMDENGKFTKVKYDITGSSDGKDDKVNHYRIKMDSLKTYISPQLYVKPMQRDVQFFIQLDEGDLELSHGIYKNEKAKINPNAKIVKKEKPKEEPKEEQEEEELCVENVEEVSKDSLMDDTQGLSGDETKAKESTNNYVVILLIVLAVIIVALLIGIIYVKKSKK